jgi:hypothetical protein
MTLREIWLILTGRPEEAAGNGAAVAPEDPRLEALDWWTTDSPSDLRERTQRADAKVNAHR